jgi:hypothetical protein
MDRIEIGDKPFDLWLKRGSRAGRAVAQFDDKILVYGEGLSPGGKAVIRALRDPDPKKAILCDLVSGDRGALVADLSLSKPAIAAAKFPAGPCSISVQFKGAGGRAVETNAMPFSLAPAITALAPNVSFGLPHEIKVDFTPALVGHETVTLIVGSRQLPALNPKPGGSLTFKLESLPDQDFLSDPQDFPVRLRVDGVESLGIDLGKSIPQGTRPTFTNVVSVKKP